MLISFGYSCQTRFVMDALDDASRRMPFDFNITTRPALVEALRTDGQSLRHDEQTAAVFRMASDGREGIVASGFFVWHDYPLADDRLTLADGWQHEIDRVNEKYDALWSRLSAALRSDEPKTLVLSNSQHNLAQFAGDDQAFGSLFGLGRDAFADITTALDAYGAKNYRLLFLTRTLADIDGAASLADPRLDHRFVGILSLRPDRRVADSIARSRSEVLARLSGSYENGLLQVSAVSPTTAIVRRKAEQGHVAHGTITLGDEGGVAWFAGRDRFRDLTLGDGAIRFADGETWRRD